MAWMRLDFEEARSLEVEALDMTALGLFWWLVDRTWEQGGVPDDPALIRRALRGRIDGAAFDDAWRQVRPLMDAGSDNRVRIPWVERAREDTIGHMRSDAARKKAERLRAKAHRPPDVRVTPPDVRARPPESADLTGQDGRTGQTNEPQKRAPRAVALSALSVPIPKAIDTPEVREAWDAYVRDRLERRHPVTLRAAELALAKLESWGPRKAAVALCRSVERGWRGVFDPDEGVQPRTAQEEPLPFVDGAAQLRAEREAARQRQIAEREAKAAARAIQNQNGALPL